MPTKFATTKEERVYQFLLTGGSFKLDNQTIYRKLKAFLIDSPGLTCMTWQRIEGPRTSSGWSITTVKAN
jgi:hypothetical protein